MTDEWLKFLHCSFLLLILGFLKNAKQNGRWQMNCLQMVHCVTSWFQLWPDINRCDQIVSSRCRRQRLVAGKGLLRRGHPPRHYTQQIGSSRIPGRAFKSIKNRYRASRLLWLSCDQLKVSQNRLSQYPVISQCGRNYFWNENCHNRRIVSITSVTMSRKHCTRKGRTRRRKEKVPLGLDAVLPLRWKIGREMDLQRISFRKGWVTVPFIHPC